MRGAPRGFTNAWPAYAYEFEELIGQAEQREALEQTKREQNRVRLRPSYRQVIVCEMVISWPPISPIASFDPHLFGTHSLGARKRP
jgi:hypothetical protein